MGWNVNATSRILMIPDKNSTVINIFDNYGKTKTIDIQAHDAN